MRRFVNYFLFAVLTLSFLTLNFSCKKEGCTDPTATNYDSDAKVDDGSCYKIYEIRPGVEVYGDELEAGNRLAYMVADTPLYIEVSYKGKILDTLNLVNWDIVWRYDPSINDYIGKDKPQICAYDTFPSYDWDAVHIKLRFRELQGIFDKEVEARRTSFISDCSTGYNYTTYGTIEASEIIEAVEDFYANKK